MTPFYLSKCRRSHDSEMTDCDSIAPHGEENETGRNLLTLNLNTFCIFFGCIVLASRDVPLTCSYRDFGRNKMASRP